MELDELDRLIACAELRNPGKFNASRERYLAEISFKAGYKQGTKDNYDCGVEDRKLGIREVVDAVGEIFPHGHVFLKEWQDKLKSWGIEEVK